MCKSLTRQGPRRMSACHTLDKFSQKSGLYQVHIHGIFQHIKNVCVCCHFFGEIHVYFPYSFPHAYHGVVGTCMIVCISWLIHPRTHASGTHDTSSSLHDIHNSQLNRSFFLYWTLGEATFDNICLNILRSRRQRGC